MAAAVVEVIEHFDEPRLRSFERVLFGHARPKTVIVTLRTASTTRNSKGCPRGRSGTVTLRFEWSGAEFGRLTVVDATHVQPEALREGFRQIHVLSSPADADAAVIERAPLWNNKRTEHGPVDVIGYVHGSQDELEELLGLLGYEAVERPEGGSAYTRDFASDLHPVRTQRHDS
jgi:hypothetical protein